MAPAVSRGACLLIPLNLPAPVPVGNFGPRVSCRLSPCASRRAELRGELSPFEKNAACLVGELRTARILSRRGMAPAVSRGSCHPIPLNLPAPAPVGNFGPRVSCRLSPYASRRAGLRGELSRVEKRAVLARGALRRAAPAPSGDGSRCFSRRLPSHPAEPSGSCPAEELRAARLLTPFSFGPKVSFPAGGLSKLFPRMHAARRTRRGLVRIGKCRARDGEPTGPETPAFPKSRADSESGEQKHSGVAGGGWKGVLRGAASPKQHPPSPVRRTHHLKRKYERTQSRPGATAPRQNPRLASTPGASAPRRQGSGGLPLIPSSRRKRDLRLLLSLERATLFEKRSRPALPSLPSARATPFEIRSRPGGIGKGGASILPPFPPSPLPSFPFLPFPPLSSCASRRRVIGSGLSLSFNSQGDVRWTTPRK